MAIINVLLFYLKNENALLSFQRWQPTYRAANDSNVSMQRTCASKKGNKIWERREKNGTRQISLVELMRKDWRKKNRSGGVSLVRVSTQFRLRPSRSMPAMSITGDRRVWIFISFSVLLLHSERLRSHHQPNGKRHIAQRQAPFLDCIYLWAEQKLSRRAECERSAAHNYTCTLTRDRWTVSEKGLYSLFRFGCIASTGVRSARSRTLNARYKYPGVSRECSLVHKKLFDGNSVCVK